MILASLFLVVAAWFGVELVRRPLAHLLPVERVAAGAVVGLAMFTWLLYWAAAAVGLGPGVLVAVSAAFAGGGLLLRWAHRAGADDAPRAERHEATLGWIAFVVGGAIWIARIFRQAVYWGPEGIFTGSIHNYGDIGLHLAIVTAFVHGENLPPENPILAGMRLSYPFLADFLAAAMVRGGMEITRAMTLEGVSLGAAFAICLAALGTELTGSRRAGTLGALLFLLTGGLGFASFFRDWARWTGAGSLLAHLSHEYTHLPEARIFWLNPLIGVHVSQRSFLFGFPMAALVFLCWWRGLQSEGREARRLFALAGLQSGMLPLFHTSTFLLVACLGVVLALLFWRPRDWMAWGLVMAAIAAPAIVWFAPAGNRLGLARLGAALGWPPQAQSLARFFYPHFGWEKGSDHVVWFWFKNLGLFPVLFGVALASRSVAPRLRRFGAPFALCFLVPNLLSLAPWVGDNMKFMVFFPLAGGALVAVWLVRASQAGGWRRAAAIAAGLSLVLSGALDVYRLGAGLGESYLEFSRDDVRVAEFLRAEARPRAVILAAPTFNSPVFLAGRKVLLGYGGHLWTHGIDYAARERDVLAMMRGDARAEDLVRAYGVSHVLIGDLERREFRANQAFFDGRYPKVAQIGPYAIYRTEEAARSSRRAGSHVAGASEGPLRPGTATTRVDKGREE